MDPVPPNAVATIAPSDIRIVLVGTQHPGNIGSSARAMRTMGFDRLVLVGPERFPHNEADMMAAGAGEVLASARVCATLAEAVADCRLVLGCTARSRRVALDELAPREAAARVRAASADAPVALVFGRERTGLDNDELQLCHAAVHIPSDPGYGSLNLAAAVQVLCYELRLAHLEAAGTAQVAAGAAPQPRGEGPASHAELEGFFAQLAETLDAIDFHKGRAPDSAMRKLRRIFLRSDLDARELRLLRGVLADAQRMARLATGRGAAGGGQVL
jgi:tRNA (cytidine32/uridine32-2'-O)-methyltransferase